GLVALLPLHPLEYRLNRVLQQVGQSLRHLLGITIQLNVAFWKPCFETDLGTGALLESNSLTDLIRPRLVGEHRRRDAGEGGRLVDQVADAVDLAYERGGAVGERVGVVRDLRQVHAAQPRGREAYRGQRVLDLARDPVCDLR